MLDQPTELVVAAIVVVWDPFAYDHGGAIAVAEEQRPCPQA